jgi:hypothetical protein
VIKYGVALTQQESCYKISLSIKHFRNLEHINMYKELAFTILYRGGDKSLAQPGRKQATATEDF